MMYLWLLKLYAEQVYKLQHPEMYVNFMLVSTVPNYQTGVYRCRNHEIAEGFKEFKRLFKPIEKEELVDLLSKYLINLGIL